MWKAAHIILHIQESIYLMGLNVRNLRNFIIGVGKGKMLFITYSIFWCSTCSHLNWISMYSGNIMRFKNLKSKMSKSQEKSFCIHLQVMTSVPGLSTVFQCKKLYGFLQICHFKRLFVAECSVFSLVCQGSRRMCLPFKKVRW